MDDLFIELLQVSLGTRYELPRAPSAAEWVSIYLESQKQAVLGLMLEGLERLPKEQLPKRDLLLQWIGLAQMNERSYLLQCEKANKLTARFRIGGFDICVLKGIGTAQLYPIPARRQCGDIDIWVSGNRKKVTKWLKTQCDVSHAEWHHTGAQFFEDVPVEVHFYPAWQYNPSHNRILQCLFWLMKKSQLKDRPIGFNYPTPEFEFVFSLVHTFHHLLEEGVGMRHIVDYFYILKALPIAKRDESIKRIERLGLKKFLGAMVWVLKEVCGMQSELMLCEPDQKEGRFLLKEIMAGGNLGKSRTDGLMRNSWNRYCLMLKHYPSEVLWMVPWKVWHRTWKLFNN